MFAFSMLSTFKYYCMHSIYCFKDNKWIINIPFFSTAVTKSLQILPIYYATKNCCKRNLMPSLVQYIMNHKKVWLLTSVSICSHQETSPIKQNPYVNVGAGNSPLRLAINTAQYGRTFQDRTHAFLLAPRSSEFMLQKIVNLNVRGKRGNIVQVYPAVEYDFFPTNMEIKDGDLVHIQWTGKCTVTKMF